MQRDTHRILDSLTLAALEQDALPDADPASGVQPLDVWSNGRYGAVLFLVDRHDHCALHHVDAERTPGAQWRTPGGGGFTSTRSPQRLLAGRAPGLHRLGGGTRDPVRLTIGIATPDVVAIRLRDDRGVRERPPGREGFFLLGITFQDPITHASALDRSDTELEGEPLLL
jgi:hypothetical protein